jgi:phosphodiesterase/alkaline phosphatase D-like protein
LAAGSATTSPATTVHHTTAVLHGNLDPQGDPGIVDCHFEWGTTVAYGNTASCAQGNSFSSPADVSALLSGLTPNTTYHFRLDVETTSSGGFQGADLSFTTRRAPQEHTLVASFGSAGTAGSTFGQVNQLTIDRARRKLYAFDRSTKRIYGYDISAPPAFPGAAGFSTVQLDGEYKVANTPLAADSTTGLGSSGNVYLGLNVEKEFTHAGTLAGFNPSGAALGGFPVDPIVNPGGVANFATINGAAVSPAGEIWIALNTAGTKAANVFLRYKSNGEYVGSVPRATENKLGWIFTFAPNGDLYAAGEKGTLWKYTAASNYESATKLPVETGNLFWGLAVDTSDHTIYATENEGLVMLNEAGEQFDEISGNFTFSGDGVAVDPANHDLYVAQKTKDDVYAPGAALPPLNVTTSPAAPIGGSTATLNGLVDPEGTPVSSCKFEWGTKSFGITEHEVPCSSLPGSGSGGVAVSAQLSGLEPGNTYSYRLVAGNGSFSEKGEIKEFTTNPLPGVGSPSVSNLTKSSATLKASVEPKGFDTSYRFEYGPTNAYGTSVPIPDGDAGSSTGSVVVSAPISGLSADTTYHWRIVVSNENGSVTLPDQLFVSYGPVKAETVGSPIRTATTALLSGRVAPDGTASTFRFEYGDQGPCDSNPCTALPAQAAGSGATYELVSEEVEGLQPGTTYHYRVIAENGNPGSPAYGEDMTVTTRASDSPLTHGHFPGPPDSDRAYEQVSLPDGGGNPVSGMAAISDNGERVVYVIHGGNPISAYGDQLNEVFSERTANGWQNKNIFPSREESVGSSWSGTVATPDLSALTSVNASGELGLSAIYRLSPDGPAGKVWGPPTAQGVLSPIVSDDLSLMTLIVGVGHIPHVFDVSSGTPEEIDQLPDGSFPACGSSQAVEGGVDRSAHWVSADGRLSFFVSRGNSCGSPAQLYVRDVGVGETKRVSPEPLSGPSCEAKFIRSTSDAAFFWSQARLAADDTAPSECGNANVNGDIYRYDLASESVECLTCVGPGVEAAVSGVNSKLDTSIAVAEDGSRVYFRSNSVLVPGGNPGIYRVEVASGEIAYVAAANQVGTEPFFGSMMSPDGATLVFKSNAPSLNAIGGQQNAGTTQYYIYNDKDRSLACASCPQDGSTPRGDVSPSNPSLLGGPAALGPNVTPISADGGIFAFVTPTALVNADQNTTPSGQDSEPGTDVYEWRDGRLLLITDGTTNWPDRQVSGGGFESEAPSVEGIAPSGRDLFFMASVQYTPDALDGYRRMYDARIGGGFESPPPPKPCPLEVCQGTPKGAPEEQAAGSGTFAGGGNAKPAARHKHKKHKKQKAHKKASHHKANHKRRASR